MKSLFLSLTLLLSIGASAQTYVKITPEIPVDCTERDAPNVNNIFDVNQFETEQQLELTFKTIHASCVSEKLNRKSLFSPGATMWRKGLTLPWHYTPSVQVIEIGENVAQVTIVFDKDKIFKRSNYRDFKFTFSPIMTKNIFASTYYPWNIYLFLDKEFGKTTVEFR